MVARQGRGVPPPCWSSARSSTAIPTSSPAASASAWPLGRAIIREPVAFLMDEPLSNLDALLRVQMRTELLRLHKRVGRTTIYVTHDQVEAMTMADRIVVMRDGVIQQVGTPGEVYATPANTFVATFVGSPPMNLIAGRIESRRGQRVFRGPFELPLDGLAPTALGDGPVTAGHPAGARRARRRRASPAPWPRSVELVEHVGADSFVLAHLGGRRGADVRVDAASPIREGDRIFVRLPQPQLRLFDAAGIAIARERS